MKIRVPASSANLGPGFDSFGLAWQLYNEISFELSDDLSISGCEERFRNEKNLCYASYRHTLETCGLAAGGLSVAFEKTEIPVSRGLGSSAALITAGVLAANALHDLGLDRQEVFSLATEIEGHPDNIAPALFGGLTVSLMHASRPLTRRFPLDEKLCFTLLIPPFELSTALSRSVMPAEVSMRDAVFNLSRAALLPKALAEGDTEILRLTLDDRLHQPYRTKLIDGWEKAKGLSEELGAVGICISGAGSTLLCIAEDEAFGEKLREAAGFELPAWRIAAIKPDADGAVIL